MAESARCLISNENWPPEAIVASYLVDPDGIDDVEKAKLQKLWGMKDTLNFDMFHNRVYLRADWAATYKAHRWGIIPQRSLINTIVHNLLQLKATKKNAPWNAVCPEEHWPYTYQFVDFSLQDHMFSRLVINADQNATNKLASHTHPFDLIPPLSSPCHPYFVVYNALRQYDDHLEELTVEQLEVYSWLRLIRSLWEELVENPYVDEDTLAETGQGTFSSPTRGGECIGKRWHDDGVMDEIEVLQE